MRPCLQTLLAAGLSLTVLGASAQSIRPGLWEFRSQVGGNPEMEAALAQMQQQMAAMPPEQRRRMQEMLAQQGMSMGQAGAGSSVVKVCITPEMAARQELPTATEGECTSTILSRSANTLKMTFACKNPPSSGEATYTFTGDTGYTMKMAMQTAHEGRPQKVTIDGRSQWLSRDCGSVKPAR
jgi:hypothetical protein